MSRHEPPDSQHPDARLARRLADIEQQLRFLTNPSGLKGAWIALTLEGAWKNQAGGVAQAAYLKDIFNFVHLRGRIEGGAAGSQAFTLPAGYRPGSNDFYAGAAYAGGSADAIAINILANGATGIYFAGTPTGVGLGGVTFLAEN